MGTYETEVVNKFTLSAAGTYLKERAGGFMVDLVPLLNMGYVGTCILTETWYSFAAFHIQVCLQILHILLTLLPWSIHNTW